MYAVKLLEKAKGYTMENKYVDCVEGMHLVAFYMDGEYFILFRVDRQIVGVGVKDTQDIGKDANTLINKVRQLSKNNSLEAYIIRRITCTQ